MGKKPPLPTLRLWTVKKKDKLSAHKKGNTRGKDREFKKKYSSCRETNSRALRILGGETKKNWRLESDEGLSCFLLEL